MIMRAKALFTWAKFKRDKLQKLPFKYQEPEAGPSTKQSFSKSIN